MTVSSIAPVQATEVNYQLGSLGWKAFQDLCGTILAEVLGQTVETYGPGHDGGRDGAFRGTWRSVDGAELSGAFTAQCKFTAKDTALSLSLLKEDLLKAALLTGRGLADVYILMTNHTVTGDAATEIEEAFRATGIKQFRIFGSERITRFIVESPRLRRLVPRVYGLGDLTQIIDSRAYAQAEQLLFSLRDDLSKFVPTGAYRQAARALTKHGFVLLLGEPACGKSTIASTLALSAVDEWGLLPVKVDGPEEFTQHWNPNETQQFFWIDDIFGATQYQPDVADRWNKVFVRLRSAIRAGVRVVATSRDYIYRRALSDVKESAFPLLRDSQVIIKVQALLQSEKQDILYSHVRRGDQPKAFREAIKPYLEAAADSGHFLPEIARRLGSATFTNGMKFANEATFRAFFEKPEDFLVDVIKRLGPDETAALTLLFMHGGRVASPVVLDSADRDGIERLGATTAGVFQALTTLEDSLLRQIDSGEGRFWTFRHPTIADAVGTLTAENVELLDIYLRGTPTTKLLREVTCGAAVAGAKVKVPVSRYDLIADRVNALRESWDKRRVAYNFLSERCGKTFLKRYLERYPLDWKEVVQVNAGLSGSAEVRLVGKLIESELLPDEWRKQFVEAVAENAVEIPSADFLTVPAIRDLFTTAERDYILARVREDALPYLHDAVDRWKSDCDTDDDPESHFEDLVGTLDEFKRLFLADTQAQRWLSSALSDVDDAVDELKRDQEERERQRERDADRDPSPLRPATMQEPKGRSIFDDVDE